MTPATTARPPIPEAGALIGAPGQIPGRWIDRFAGSDPGLNRLRMALLTVLTIAAILVAEALFVHFTHALQIQTRGAALPAAEAAKVAAANHEFLVIAMLIGAIVGMISTFGVMDKTARGQLVTMLFLPVPMIAALALGLALGGQRILALVSFPVILAVGTYGRRFGPRGFIGGLLLFMGDFLGFFLHGAVTLGDLGWLAAEISVGTAMAIAVRFAFFSPRQAKALERTQRSYSARARKAAALALKLLDDPRHTARAVRRLHHQLVRLNEAALMIDAQLGDPGAVADGSSAQLLHQRLFDAELALANIARFAEAMARSGLPAPQHFEARLALRDLIRGENEAARAHATRLIGLLREAGPVPPGENRAAVVVPHRFAGSVIALADAMTEWMALGAAGEGEGAFQPSVQLFGGWLPGSAQVSSTASLEPGTRLGDRIRLALYSRTAIQMGIAVGAAIALGDLLSPRRFYWAVIAAFVTFMGANNSGEQVRKAFFRVAGTLIGIAAGSLLVTAVGHHTYWSIAVILASLFLGFYLMRINYAFMVIGITVMVSLLYVQLDEFSNSLLLLRLEETALGAAVAIVVVMLVLPLRTRRVLRIAVRDLVQAVGRLADHASDHLLSQEHGTDVTLRSDARAVDAAYQALTTTAQPLRRNLSGGIDEDTGRALRLASASRNYSRNLVADTEMAGPLDAGTRLDIELASATLRQSLDVVAGALTGPRDGVYTRSSALFDQAERRIEEHSGIVGPAQLAIRDLKLIDGTMAGMAEALGLSITDYDTVPAGSGSSGGIRVRGRVRGPDGAGVLAAVTLIDPRGRQVARTVTDADGGYWLDAPTAGAYILLASAGSHRPAASTVIVRQPGNGSSNGSGTVVNVLLAATGDLAGTVTAAAGGHLVAGAHMTLTDARGTVVGTQRTGTDGGYAFSALNDGEYTLAASADLYHPAARTVIISGGEDIRADIELTPDASLSGVVVTKGAARPVPGARITLLDTTGAVVAEADTDETGRYAIKGLTGGEYTAVASGYPPAASTLHITGREGTVRHDVEFGHARADAEPRHARADAGSQDRQGQLACPGRHQRLDGGRPSSLHANRAQASCVHYSRPETPTQRQ
ncbi:MAG TPA: carboxypeptidase regulatory-like domain-containing protein [Streptosporangiaceae bacterium]|nr:carboxypeptidase regulatory-like domain-containing protein [Streptosporangiaceae bacterium]